MLKHTTGSRNDIFNCLIMKKFQWQTSICLMLFLGGCSTLPHFEDPVATDKLVPRVSDMVDEIQDELIRTLAQSQQPESPFAALQTTAFVVNVNLTLEVTDAQGINPALSYINPLKKAGTNFTAALSGQFKGQQHRTFSLTFTFLLDHTKPFGTPRPIDQTGSGLKGDLGIGEVLASGLRYETNLPYKLPVVGVADISGVTLPSSAASTPSFGATIDFTLIYGLGGGPGWTLTHFTGPNLSTGLLNYLRTNKNTLTLSFARVSKSGGHAPFTATDNSIQDATKAAQDNATRLILQRLLPP